MGVEDELSPLILLLSSDATTVPSPPLLHSFFLRWEKSIVMLLVVPPLERVGRKEGKERGTSLFLLLLFPSVVQHSAREIARRCDA